MKVALTVLGVAWIGFGCYVIVNASEYVMPGANRRPMSPRERRRRNRRLGVGLLIVGVGVLLGAIG